MKYRRLFLCTTVCIACAVSTPLSSQSRPCPALKQSILDTKFKPGQVWSYQSRPGETNSTLTVLEVDSNEKVGVIVHIRVDGLRAHNSRGKDVPSVEHMPFTRDAMLLSVNHLLKSNQPLPTLEGLNRWRSDCGGVYTISVRDAVEVMEKTLNAP
jgi:hypothetical protein